MAIETSAQAMAWATHSRQLREREKACESVGMYASAKQCDYLATRTENAIIRYASKAESELATVLRQDARTHIGRLARSL